MSRPRPSHDAAAGKATPPKAPPSQDALGRGGGAPEEGARHSLRRRRKAILAWSAAVVWAGVIFLMSANTGNNLNHGNGIISLAFQWLRGLQSALIWSEVDVISPFAHFLEYTVFGFLLAFALSSTRGWKRGAIFLGAVAIASLYGVTDEIHQIFVDGRTPDVLDWLVDTSGGALGAAVLMAVKTRRKSQRAMRRLQ